MNENLTLDEVIEKLQEARRLYGDIPITVNIKDIDCINYSQYIKKYNIKDVYADKNTVTIYNY